MPHSALLHGPCCRAVPHHPPGFDLDPQCRQRPSVVQHNVAQRAVAADPWTQITGPCRLNATEKARQNPAMRVVTWNMGMGPGRQHLPGAHDQAWHYLLGLGPDLAFLQETLPPSWVRGEGTVVHGPFKQWGSAIFSPRFPLGPHPLAEDHHLRKLGTYLAFATVSLPDGSDVFAVSVHARHAKATPEQ